MSSGMWLNIGLVLVFVLIGGVFAGTEMALVSLREGQINQLHQQGGRGARAAAVARDPNRFLAAVQIGVTVAGLFSAAYGASTLAPGFTPLLERIGVPAGMAGTVALIALTLIIAYLSLVLGELAPKRIALQRSAAIARIVGPVLDRFATLMRPVVWLLSVSTNAVVSVLGGDPTARSQGMSGEELRALVITHEGWSDAERRILDDVFDAADRSLGEVMRPRGEVAFVAADVTVAQASAIVQASPYSRYPITQRGFDDIIGFLHVRDLLGAPPDLRVRRLARDVVFLPATNRLLPSLSRMRAEGRHLAVVVDEYGGTDGIVTLEDLVEELVGDIRDEYDVQEPVRVPRRDGVLPIDATLTIEEFADETGIELEDGPYETAAGFVVHRLGRLATVGDSVEVDGHTIAVTEVDSRRITRLEVRTTPVPVPSEQPTG